MTFADLPWIEKIYGYAVNAGFQTGHLSNPSTAYWLQWFDVHSHMDCPVWVAVLQRQIVGWVSLSYYRNGREAFHATREVSYYVHPDFFHQGVGTALLDYAEHFASANGVNTLLAVVISENKPSIEFLLKRMYQQWALLPGVVNSGNGKADHLYFGKQLQR